MPAAGGVLGATETAPATTTAPTMGTVPVTTTVSEQPQGAVLGATETHKAATKPAGTNNGGVLGAEETTNAAPAAGTHISQLPFTGFDLWIVGGFGALLLLGGLIGFRVAGRRA